MRTNIDIEDEFMETALKYSGLKSKKDIVNRAMQKYSKYLLRLEMLKLQGSMAWEGNLEEMRTNGHK
jgi:Arc/MetJ family transcription regulator